jgi:hypothetical protein
MQSHVQIQWLKSMTLRCTCGDTWVDFGFELGGGEKELPLERSPAGGSPDVTPELAGEFREALVEHLETTGYSVVDIGK